MQDKKIKGITLYPIELGYGQPRYSRGWPALSEDIQILKRLQKLCEPYGTQIEIEDTTGKIII